MSVLVLLILRCVRTITTIYPSPGLLAAAADSIATFLKHQNHNLRYVGIDALAGIVKINSQYAQVCGKEGVRKTGRGERLQVRCGPACNCYYL